MDLLDALEARLPELLSSSPADGEFWMAFAGEADVIEDRTGDPAEQVSHRINGMLEKQGRFLAHVETNNV
ncbi:hypothetical protein D9M69_682000 [compost metagenome]